MKEVLILGNGVSRLEYQNFIEKWGSEIWACNSAYLEYYKGIIPRLDVIIGDHASLKDVVQYKKKYGGKFLIFGKNPRSTTLPGVKMVDVPRSYIKDSGTTLVARAILQGYDIIYVLGFDLGGRDLYVKGHESRNKERWIKNWRFLAGQLGLDRVKFVGKDHKPYILSNDPSDKYAQLYLNGYDHIDTDNNKMNYRIDRKVLILGNGASREKEAVKKFINKWDYEIWVCNKACIEAIDLIRISRVGTISESYMLYVKEVKDNNNLDYSIYTIEPDKKSQKFIEIEDRIHYFKEQRKWKNTGILLLLQAMYEKYEEIFLAGFDFDNTNLYNNKKEDGEIFKKQFLSVSKEFGIKQVKFVGKQPDFLI